MPFPVLGSNSAVAGYEIDNSLRFNDDDSAYLSRTPSSGGNRNTFTFSCWVKLSDIGNRTCLFGVNGNNNNEVFQLIIHQNGYLMLGLYTYNVFETNMLLRDPSAYYHIVLSMDSTLGSSDNRTKLYVNGDRITSWSGYNLNNITNGFNFGINRSGEPMSIGATPVGGDPMGGYMSEINFVDGTALGPDKFGETNDNGVWVPIKPDVSSYGTNGFFLEFQNSGALGTDTSGNGNNFTPTNLTATDQTTDTPTNNFCTLNALHKSTSDVVLSEGNLKMVSGYSAGWQHCASTIAVSNGKWYWEAKATTVSASDKTSIGVFQFNTTDVDFIGSLNLDRSSKGLSGHGAGTGGYSYAQGDIIMCAMDIDNNKIYWGKNGTFFGTLDPANGTGSTTQTVDNSNFCVPAVGGYGGSTWELNFGVPQFSISSGNSDANGFGNFEYAVPSGYYALCTKNLAEYG